MIRDMSSPIKSVERVYEGSALAKVFARNASGRTIGVNELVQIVQTPQGFWAMPIDNRGAYRVGTPSGDEVRPGNWDMFRVSGFVRGVRLLNGMTGAASIRNGEIECTGSAFPQRDSFGLFEGADGTWDVMLLDREIVSPVMITTAGEITDGIESPSVHKASDKSYRFTLALPSIRFQGPSSGETIHSAQEIVLDSSDEEDVLGPSDTAIGYAVVATKDAVHAIAGPVSSQARVAPPNAQRINQLVKDVWGYVGAVRFYRTSPSKLEVVVDNDLKT